MSIDVKLLEIALDKGVNIEPDAFEVLRSMDDAVDVLVDIIINLKANREKKNSFLIVTRDLVTGESSETGNEEIEEEEPEVDVDVELPVEKEEEISLDEDSPVVEDSGVDVPVVREDLGGFDDFGVVVDTTGKSYTDGSIKDIITYFNSRYDKLYSILSKRPELSKAIPIVDAQHSKEQIAIIGMVSEIIYTKNGHRIYEVEDSTDKISVLFSKDSDIFSETDYLVRDEVIGITGKKGGSLFIPSSVIQPSFTKKVPKDDLDFSVAFISDVHIGSETFLEKSFQNFIDWLNGKYGSSEQREIGLNVKYLLIAGDLIDGIGVYPNQDEQLTITDVKEQYDYAGGLLEQIRDDVKIILAPGNHDVVRLAEPQPSIPEEYAGKISSLPNIELVSNPAEVNLEGLDVIMYHGRGFDDMAMGVKGLSQERTDLIMKELLEKRHLAPIYGERTSLSSELEDYMVIERIPHVLHTGHIHINSYKKYKGVHLLNSGTFQSQTDFQKIYNIMPTCAKVPVLYKGNMKILSFLDEEENITEEI